MIDMGYEISLIKKIASVDSVSIDTPEFKLLGTSIHFVVMPHSFSIDYNGILGSDFLKISKIKIDSNNLELFHASGKVNIILKHENHKEIRVDRITNWNKQNGTLLFIQGRSKSP